MTREEAIKHLAAKLECLTRSKGFREKCDSYNSYEGCYECDLGYKQGNIGEQIESLKLAIKALAQEPCEESISREAVLDLCDSKDPDYKVIHFKEDVECLPSVTPHPKTGHWQKISADKYSEHAAYYFRCSECGKDIIGEHNYCANCGAKMESEVENGTG